MLPVDSTMANLIRQQVRAPRVYLQCQLPAITNATMGTIDASKLGSEIILDKCLSLNLTQVLELGSDSMDIKFDNTDGSKTPISPSVFSRYFFPGSLDNKYQLYIGLENEGLEEVYPKGVFISETAAQQSQEGINELTISALDQFSMFQGDVYTQFPPKLFGNQLSANFNPNYVLKTTDYKNYKCDAINWMSATSLNGLLASDYIAVAVYASTYNSGSTPVPNSGTWAYTIDYVNGVIQFSSAQDPKSTISVDARPQGMAPELMLTHLFSDFGNFSTSFMKFDRTGVVLPVMEIARDRTIMDVAQDIVYATAPRGVQWRLYFDENGYLNFCEPAVDGPPVKTLYDEVDILKCSPEYTSRDIANVVRATATLNNGTNANAITQVAYDVNSISVFGQKPTYDLPTQMLATIPMMDPGTALSFMGGMCNSALIAMSTPTINMEIDILPDPSLQVADPIAVIENKTGINKNFYINQITTDISEGIYKQTLRLTQFKGNQDFQFGLSQNIGAPAAGNPNAVETQTGMIATVTMQNPYDPYATTVVFNGAPALDMSFNPVIFTWGGQAITFSITLEAMPSGVQAYMWRWFYVAEDAYVGSTAAAGDGSAANVWGSSTGFSAAASTLFGNGATYTTCAPYDVLNNVDSPRSRRFYWPILRCSSWLSNDGAATAYTAQTTLTDTWNNGPGATNATTYGNLRVGQNDYFSNTTSNFSGVQLYNGTYAATQLSASSTIKYGVDFGPSTSATLHSGIHRKQTPCFLCIFVATTAGTMQFKRIPFLLSL